MTNLVPFIILMIVVSFSVVLMDFIIKNFKKIVLRVITGVGISTITTLLTGNVEEGLGLGIFAFLILLLTNNHK